MRSNRLGRLTTLVAMAPLATLATLAAVAALLLSLAACGPGVGGTGTGAEPELARFGASAAPLCGSDVASLLSCPPAGTAAALEAGTAEVLFSDSTLRMLATLSGNRLEFSAPCSGLRFVGDWGRVGSQPPRFYGFVESTGSNALAIAELQAVASGLSLRISDDAGRLLFGPVLLNKVTAPRLAGCG